MSLCVSPDAPHCSTDLLALPTCDPDKTFAVQISHEETMLQTPVAFVQCALLHTSSNGERRIRCVVYQRRVASMLWWPVSWTCDVSPGCMLQLDMVCQACVQGLGLHT